jgi:molecular chaperone HscB
VDFKQNYFEIFQMLASYQVDTDLLADRYRELQLSVHPDKFADASDQEKRLSVQWATQVNAAYVTLKEPLKRAIYMLEMSNTNIEHNPTLDPIFLMEQIELREALEDIEASGDAGLTQLDQYRADVNKVFENLQRDFDAQINDSIIEAEQTVYKMQFVHKLLTEANQLEERLLDY